MRPVRITQTGVGVSPPVPLDLHQATCNIGLGAIVDGTVTFSVQHTFGDVFDPLFDPDTATWLNHPDITAATATVDANYAFFPTAIRLNITAGTGTVELNILQAGLVS